MRSGSRDPVQSLSSAGCLPHNFHIRLQGQELCQAPSNDFVIVEQKDSNGFRHLRHGGIVPE